MEVPTVSSMRREESDYGAGDHGFLKAYVTRETRSSRRFSASNLKSFREETRSFRHTTNICSTASSPGYISRDQIDPSTYSFTVALKALPVKSVNGWDCMSYINGVDGNALNSKWSEAEKYICNPYSGQFPLECLSSKALSERALPTGARMTRSGPLIFSYARFSQMRPSLICEGPEPPPEIDGWRVRRQRLPMRNVGTQSSHLGADFSSNNSSGLDTKPSVKEGALRSFKWGGSPSPSYNIEKRISRDEVVEKTEEVDHKTCNEGKEDKRTAKYNKSWGCLVWGLWVPRKQKRREVDKTFQKARKTLKEILFQEGS